MPACFFSVKRPENKYVDAIGNISVTMEMDLKNVSEQDNDPLRSKPGNRPLTPALSPSEAERENLEKAEREPASFPPGLHNTFLFSGFNALSYPLVLSSPM